jgi:hypothetical protein
MTAVVVLILLLGRGALVLFVAHLATVVALDARDW